MHPPSSYSCNISTPAKEPDALGRNKHLLLRVARETREEPRKRFRQEFREVQSDLRLGTECFGQGPSLADASLTETSESHTIGTSGVSRAGSSRGLRALRAATRHQPLSRGAGAVFHSARVDFVETTRAVQQPVAAQLGPPSHVLTLFLAS
ncbi:hypothetical protein THAOC_05565 [Thalassiosira oceanica]|uniref:Uncharacterized protein n=1 Tax=Thalassiosira oceanica TaxID=159749 RepID=K0T2K3_THAOC|nr:hypothetical protein THAOC_05565 [Thalassiosira oceanica]|eukprot:EJK72863.1 hypothetical protein THAOC_05565 [Thalassiosira oceanica]